MRESTAPNHRPTTGTLCTISGGILWGFSGTCGQYLFMNYGIDARLLTTIRMVGAGLILLLVGFLRERENMTGIWKTPKDARRLILFAVCGLMFCQFSYMQAISYSNSGTATTLQYLGPVLIMIITCFRAGKLPNKREVIAILLALLGTFLLATHGDVGNMVLTREGLMWGLLSAVAVSLYTMLPVELMRKWGSIPVVGYAMLIGGLVLGLGGRVWNFRLSLDLPGTAALAAIVLFGTVIAFTMYLYGVKEIGPVKGSMLSSTEPVSATFFMVVWLHSSFGLMDLAGFLCIMTTVFLLALEKEPGKA
ncbi:MAG: DMT family transporter [Eubacteriales bacterium]|nr:DMT family transporter [Eubacteriales bacterium]